VEGIVPALRESLGQILAVEGVRTVVLIDVATGMVVRSAGTTGTRFAATAADIADEVRLVRATLGPGQRDEDIEEIALTAAGSLHLSKILDTRLGDGLLLFVDLDRTRSNVALASLLISQVASTVLA
jgi:hypothetical protein